MDTKKTFTLCLVINIKDNCHDICILVYAEYVINNLLLLKNPFCRLISI